MNELDQLMQDLRRRVAAREGGRARPPNIDSTLRTVEMHVEAMRHAAVSSAPSDTAWIDDPRAPVPGLASAFELPELALPATEPFIAAPRVPGAGQPTLASLMESHDAEFVRHAFLVLLGREPDPAGAASFVHDLRHGGVSRVALLWSIRHSPEGMARGVSIPGLARAFQLERLERLPVLGTLVSIARGLASLPNALRRIDRLERDAAAAAATLAQLDRAFAARDERIATLAREGAPRQALEALAGRLVDTGAAAQAVHERTTALEGLTQGHANALPEVRADLSQVHERTTALEALTQGHANALPEVRADLSQIRERVQDNESRAQVRLLELERLTRVDPPLEDAFYVEFENRFRGTPEDIRQRVEVYIPVIAGSGVGEADAPIVDIGCGRGEWLSALKENGFTAIGIDTNLAMVAECVAQGLDARANDGLTYLTGLAPQSLRAISFLHVVEHVSFSTLVTLIRECRRVLRPGGILIMETPNPENLVVGACNFWFDPTHRAPLPPELLRWTTEACGFAKTEILRLHAVPKSLPEGAGDEPLRSLVVPALLGPQDYAVIATMEAP